jgi:2,4-dienoyl-CoA reductase-like NADH-dependent reductase (Old Yellow Enzyme family)
MYLSSPIKSISQSAMTERLCIWNDAEPKTSGQPTPEYIRLYEEWGQGGIGVIVLGNIPCDARYPEAKGNAIMDPTGSWDPVEAFKPVMAACKAKGSLVIGQVTHAGRVSLVVPRLMLFTDVSY